VLSGKHNSTDKDGNVSFTYKKPRSSKFIERLFAKEDIVYIIKSSNGGDTLGVIGPKITELGEVSGISSSGGFVECKSAAGSFIVNPRFMNLQAEVDEPSGGGGKKKKKKDGKKKK